MSRGNIFENTTVGAIYLATKTCDRCGKAVPDDLLGWIQIQFDIVEMGQPHTLDFCSRACIRAYFAAPSARAGEQTQ
jgi:hypothetical protein